MNENRTAKRQVRPAELVAAGVMLVVAGFFWASPLLFVLAVVLLVWGLVKAQRND